MATAPFVVQPQLTAVAMAFQNQELIADRVCPRVPVARREFKWSRWNFADGFTVPNTRVGRKSFPNEVEFGATEVPGIALDYGLDDVIPYDDIENAIPPIDPRARAVETLTNLIMLDREVRVANLFTTLANYSASQRITLSGTSQFNDPNSDPITVIMTGLDSVVQRPNVMVIGRPAWSRLATNPKIVSASLGNNGSNGVARREDVARLFELEEVIVGEAFVNTAAPGPAVSISRAWGKHISLIRRERTFASATGSMPTFAATFQVGQRFAGTIQESRLGLRGSEVVRVGESVLEVIAAQEYGYFIQNAVA